MRRFLYIVIILLIGFGIFFFYNNKKSDIPSVNLDTEQKEQVKQEVIGSLAKKSINKEIPTTNIHTQEGIKWFEELNFQKAQQEFVQSQDDDPVALYYLGLIASYEDNDSLARSFLQKTFDEGTSDTLRNDAKEILSAYETFDLYKDASRDFLYTLLGKAYVNAGQAVLGILKLKQATLLKEDYNDAWILLGTAYILAEDYGEAEKALRHVKNSSRAEPSYYLGLASFNQKKYAEAIIAYREALDRGYTPAEDVHVKIAESFVALGKYKEGFDSYLKAIEINPDNIDLYVNPIFLQINIIKDLDVAFSLAENALKRFPRSALAHNLVAWVALEKDDLSTSKKYLDSAKDLDPKLQAIYYNYGRYYEKINDITSAKANYTKAITIDPASNISKLSATAIARFR